MAHSGDGTGWTITDPLDSEPRKDGAKEIRDLRTGVGIRIDKEHVALASSSAGGEHKEGSAVIYAEDAVTFPTNKPDGSTALAAADEGRLLLAAGKLFMYHGDHGFVATSSGSFVLTSTYDAWIDVGRQFRMILFHHVNGRNGIDVFNGTSDQGTNAADSGIFVHLGKSTDNDERIECRSQQDSGTPADTYRFDARSVTGVGTFSYEVLLA